MAVTGCSFVRRVENNFFRMNKYIALTVLSVVLVACGPTKPKVDDSALNNPILTSLNLSEVKEGGRPSYN